MRSTTGRGLSEPGRTVSTEPLAVSSPESRMATVFTLMTEQAARFTTEHPRFAASLTVEPCSYDPTVTVVVWRLRMEK